MTEENKDGVKTNPHTPLRVVRFVRPDARTRNNNLYGITFVFHLDYKTRLVHVQWSVCNGDNFNKQIGVQEALKRRSFSFPLDDVRNTGLVRACYSICLNKSILLICSLNIIQFFTKHSVRLHKLFHKGCFR